MARPRLVVCSRIVYSVCSLVLAVTVNQLLLSLCVRIDDSVLAHCRAVRETA